MAETGEVTTKDMPKSSLLGEVEVEVDIKAPAVKFYNVYAGRPHHVAKANTRKVQAYDLLEGEWGTVGNIVSWNYVYRVEGDVLAVYKSFLITIQETPKEEGVGSVVKWHLEYERSDENVPHPENFLPFLVEMTKEIDEFLLSEE